MRSPVLVLAAAAAVVLSATAFADDTVPCEDKLGTVRQALQSATLDEAKKAEVDALMEKGIERCNADDDARADGFFAQVEAILAK